MRSVSWVEDDAASRRGQRHMGGRERQDAENVDQRRAPPGVPLEPVATRHPQDAGDEQRPRLPVGEVEHEEHDERLLVLRGQCDVVVGLQPGEDAEHRGDR